MNRDPGNVCIAIRRVGLGLWLLCLILPVAGLAQQQTPGEPGYYPGARVSPYYPYPNQAPAPSNAIWPQAGQQPFGAPPPRAYPTMPAVPGYLMQPRAQVQARRPYLETSVDSTRAYVHQNLVMTISVISTVNLMTIATQLPESGDVIFRQLGGVTVSTRAQQGRREIVNTLHYQLTPLRSGRIELAPVRVNGIVGGSTPTETRYDAVASQAVQLMVSEPEPSVQPWLPLHALELNASLSNDELIGVGEPLTLIIEQRAEGMSGAQLPSPEAQLQAPGHRLYLEKSEYQGTISELGRLVGTRIDRFTLVPHQDSRVVIPAIRVDWWNVDRQRKETAVLHGRLLNELGRRQGNEGQADAQESGGITGSWLIWLGSLAIAFLLGRYWRRLAPGLRRFGCRFWLWLHHASQPLHHRLAVVLVHLSPRRHLHLIRRTVADSLPRSARLWFCVRSADDEQDADDWSQVLRFLINRRLGLPAQLPMSKLAELIIEIHPGADADKIRALLSELEAALFAGQDIQDFNNWKKEFKYQVRPHFFTGLWRRQRYLRAAGLPSLNPTVT